MCRALRAIAAFLLVSVATPITCVVVILATLIFLPLPATLPQPKPILERDASHLFDALGNEIGVFKQFETSIAFEQSEVPQILKDAVIAAEDKQFYAHKGVDVGSTIRALWDDIQNRAAVQGGSTITQQYVKNAFTGGERTIGRKIREAILASQLERTIDKETILYNYLKTIYFGEGAYGVGAASQTYFRIPVSQVNASQAALIASVIPAPSRYSPRVAPEVAEQRRLRALGEMLAIGRIDQVTYDDAVLQPVWLAVNGEPPGPATIVYPPEEQQTNQPWFTQYVKEWLETHLPGCEPSACPTLDKGGLTIETTLDPKVQQAAEEELAKAMGESDLNLQMSIVAVEPPTGYVKAMVGGRDFAYSQYNVAIRSPGRQVGSAFKPFILAAALESGIQPTARYSGAPIPFPDGYVLENYGGASYGTLDLRTATHKSVNGVYGRLIQDVGVEKSMEVTRRLGANIEPYDPARHGPSVALGAVEAKPLEVASAFGVFANHGRRAEPTPILRVTDSDGNVLIDNANAAAGAQQVIAEVVADNVTDILRGVLTSGTAGGKGLGDRPAAGKTGTADHAANAWFVGYTPTLSTAVWIGHLDCGAGPDCRIAGVLGVRGEMTGGAVPATTWQRFTKRALEGVPVTEFAEPAPIQTFADTARRTARGGFDPGPRRYPTGPSSGGPYLLDVAPPEATAPTTSTSTTTTTTVPIPGATTTTIIAN